jgi:uncharacterized integral membrane protein
MRGIGLKIIYGVIILLFLVLIVIITLQFEIDPNNQQISNIKFSPPESNWWSAITILIGILAGSIGLSFYKTKEIEELKAENQKINDRIDEFKELSTLSTISLNFHSEYNNGDDKWRNVIENLKLLITKGFINNHQAYHLSVQAWRDGFKYYTYIIRKAIYKTNQKDFDNRTNLANILTHIKSDYKCIEDGIYEKIDKEFRKIAESPKKFEKFVSYDKYYDDKEFYIPPYDEKDLKPGFRKAFFAILKKPSSLVRKKLYKSMRAAVSKERNVFQKAIGQRIWYHIVVGRYYLWAQNDFDEAKKHFDIVFDHEEQYFYHHNLYILSIIKDHKLLREKFSNWSDPKSDQFFQWKNPPQKTHQFYKNYIASYLDVIEGDDIDYSVLFKNIYFDDILSFLNADDYKKYKLVDILSAIDSYDDIKKDVKKRLVDLYRVYYVLIGKGDQKLDALFAKKKDKKKEILSEVLRFFN